MSGSSNPGPDSHPDANGANANGSNVNGSNVNGQNGKDHTEGTDPAEVGGKALQRQAMAIEEEAAAVETAPEPYRPPAAETRQAGPRFGAAGMPAEKSKDFRGSTGRLLARLRPQRGGLIAVLFLAIFSVTLSVLGPRLLGNATNIIVDGVISGQGIDFGKLHRTLAGVLALYVVSATA
ncbi:MAG TPA: hypothetical protein VNQ33_06845, partial [Acidimicrobiales bacterium]|nr:hypothetical protein [Acidimicrobiales bacterium]